tara:strand:+ start:3223 stop:4395 length:1173 start_codon:yes stop_codon:yes gene_type:complete
MKKKLVTKENQLDLFGIDPSGQDKPYKFDKSKALDKFKHDKKRETQKQLKEKQQTAKRQEEERLIWDELSVEDKLARMHGYSESTDIEILEGINEVLSNKDIESFSVNGEFFSTLRDFLLCNSRWDSDGNELEKKTSLIKSFSQFYRLHKDSQSQLRILTEDVMNAFPTDILLNHLVDTKVIVHGKDWFKQYLSIYLDTYLNEAKFLQEFITSALYDSDRRYVVSKSMGKIRIVWYIDQRCLGSDGIWGRLDAICAFFDRGYILQNLGEFHIQKSPKAIKDNIFAIQPHAEDYLKEDMEEDYLALEFWKLKVESQNNISDAWENGVLGTVLVDRTENSISLEWEYPSSFSPYDEEEITSNCSFELDSITNYMFDDNDEEIMNMIRDAEGG